MSTCDDRLGQHHGKLAPVPRLLATLPLLLGLWGGCNQSTWILGKWVFVSENGKPGPCYAFEKDQTVKVYLQSHCSGPVDELASGKWQLKREDRLALKRGQLEAAELVLIDSRTPTQFSAHGPIEGSFHHLEGTDATALLAKLTETGIIKLRAFAAASCALFGTALDQVRKLPKEDSPHMLRASDQGLTYHAMSITTNAQLNKLVFALNGDQLEWACFELAETAFSAPGPESRYETELGKPVMSLSSGEGLTRQHVLMWKSYCAELHGGFNREVDITLFVTPGERQGLLYLSEGTLTGVWDELKATLRAEAVAAPAAVTPAPTTPSTSEEITTGKANQAPATATTVTTPDAPSTPPPPKATVEAPPRNRASEPKPSRQAAPSPTPETIPPKVDKPVLHDRPRLQGNDDI